MAIDIVIPMEDLLDPMDIGIPFKVTNLDSITPIYVTAQLVTPPAGWSDYSEKQLGAVSTHTYAVFGGLTRTKPATDTAESITLRVTYYSDDTYTTKITEEDIAYTLTYINFDDASYALVDEDTFEVDLESWTKMDEAGSTSLSRSGGKVRTGSYAMLHSIGATAVGRALKSFTIGVVSNAYIRFWLYFDVSGTGYTELVTDAGEVVKKRMFPIAYSSGPITSDKITGRWICVAAKLPVNGTFAVWLRTIAESGTLNLYVDDIKVITKA